MSEVALIIIYNHQYNKNIPILEDIYKDRFSDIYHLVPFYNGSLPNVIPVFENSHFFQGYVAQGFKSYYKPHYNDYLFIGDDLLLNPKINQHNYKSYFALDNGACFLPGLINLHNVNPATPWPRVSEAFHYKIDYPGAETANLLPTHQDALVAFKQKGLEPKPLTFEQIWDYPRTAKDWFSMPKKHLLRYVKNKLLKTRHHLQYPAVGGYSDIFIVNAEAIERFVHYCGVTAVTRLFVEVGLPTSMVLAAKTIVTEEQTTFKGRALWTADDYKLLEPYNQDLDKLMNNFPEQVLYIHPIKLSKWTKKA